jgi:hypothetical protein
MPSRKSTIALSICLILIFVLSACAPGTTATPVLPTPTQKPTPTPMSVKHDPNKLCRQKEQTWDCNIKDTDRKILFSGVPVNIQIYNYDVNESDLLTAIPVEKFTGISIAGDIRFFDKDSMFGDLGKEVTLQLGITSADKARLEKLGVATNRTLTVNNLVPIQSILGKEGTWAAWTRLQTTSFEINKEGTEATIKFRIWGGDPPSGWGVGS